MSEVAEHYEFTQKITITRADMKGVYNTPKPKCAGYITYYDKEGKLSYRNSITEDQALQEQWVQRLESRMDTLMYHLENLTLELRKQS